MHQVFVHSISGPEHRRDGDGASSPKVPENGEGAGHRESGPWIFDENTEQFHAADGSLCSGANRGARSEGSRMTVKQRWAVGCNRESGGGSAAAASSVGLRLRHRAFPSERNYPVGVVEKARTRSPNVPANSPSRTPRGTTAVTPGASSTPAITTDDRGMADRHGQLLSRPTAPRQPRPARATLPSWESVAAGHAG